MKASEGGRRSSSPSCGKARRGRWTFGARPASHALTPAISLSVGHTREGPELPDPVVVGVAGVAPLVHVLGAGEGAQQLVDQNLRRRDHPAKGGPVFFGSSATLGGVRRRPTRYNCRRFVTLQGKERRVRDEEIRQRIASFPQWHYRFDLKGNPTPIPNEN